MKDYDKEAKYLNRPSKTQMSELKKQKYCNTQTKTKILQQKKKKKKNKESKEKQTGGVVVGGRHSVGGGHQTA
jgi:hypothetical protein